MEEGGKPSQPAGFRRAGVVGLGLGEMRRATPSLPTPAFYLPVLMCDLFLSSFQAQGRIKLFMKDAPLDYFPLLWLSHSVPMNLDP